MATRTARCILLLISLVAPVDVSPPPTLDRAAPLHAQTTAPKQVPGEGVLCIWAFALIASEVGRRCPGKRDEKFQASTDGSVKLLEEYVIANGGSAAFVSSFKRQYGGAAANNAELCSGIDLEIYDHLRARGGDALFKATREAVSMPGKPTFGECV